MLLKINNYPVTAGFGSLDSAHHVAHKGVDFGMPMGTPVECFSDGVVKYVSDEGARSFGKSVWVQLNDGTTAVFGHLSGFNCKAGQSIHAGQIIGYSGNTGDSTGPHLHLQLMQNGLPIDPLPYLQGDAPHEPSFTESIRSIGGFFYDLKANGLWHALTGESFAVWFNDIFDGAALAVCLAGAMLGLMGWKKGWQIVYWDVGIYLVVKCIQLQIGGA